MRRPSFDTGARHQTAAIAWARRRLVDSKGRHFLEPGDQDGVLFADSVGMGKTWEALSACAVILHGLDLRKRRGRVLIVCPPNLVTKWEDELAAGSAFRERLKAWASRHGNRGKRVEETLARLIPVRLGRHVRRKRRWGKLRIAEGTYLVSNRLIAGKKRAVALLRREQWDVVLVDEAHDAYSRAALAMLDRHRRCEHKLLLSATPFQLQPRQFNSLGRHLVRRRTQVLSHTAIAAYLVATEEAFRDSTVQGPSPAVRREAGALLHRLVARTVPRRGMRTYSVLTVAGDEHPLPARLDSLDDGKLAGLFAQLRSGLEDTGEQRRFECRYLENRFKLATNDDPQFVATRLRRYLARGEDECQSPRLRALARWAELRFAEDLDAALGDGLPRKSIVFLSFVGEGATGEARLVETVLQKAFARALESRRAEHRRHWNTWLERGGARWQHLDDLATDVDWGRYAPRVEAARRGLLEFQHDELFAVLAGVNRTFLRRLRAEFQRLVTDGREALEFLREQGDPYSLEARGAKRRLHDALSALAQWSQQQQGSYVVRYTGNESRVERDVAASAFRSIAGPWAIVASNVGAEGIDLQTYTRRLVHYDLEWNPARMEQREGRGDRIGRRLPRSEGLSVVYALIPGTYDERMFHQLVARDRWHGVLLGRAGAKLAVDEGALDARLESAGRLQRMRLDLSPRRRARK